MPEIAEVARVTHFLRLHLVGKKIGCVTAPDDANVFGKVGTSGPAFQKALTGRTVVDAGRQGKYFWLVLDKAPHPVMHLGMTGWVHIRGLQTGYTRYLEKTVKDKEQWPPKYWKFYLEAAPANGTGGDAEKVEVAFTDARRFSRIRLVDHPGAEIRKHPPLVENGPDPVVDKDVFTEEFLRNSMRKRHVPVKALLLDQANISGIGNWVGDEIMYQAKLHPEQYCDDFSDVDISTLYKAVRYVCDTAVEKLGDSDEFPKDWLFNHRWGKGKKDAATTLPNGEKITFITVGGRTSCVVPSMQKKKGRTTLDGSNEEPEIAEDAEKKGKEEESPFFDGDKKSKRKKNGKSDVKKEEEQEERPRKKSRITKSQPAKAESGELELELGGKSAKANGAEKAAKSSGKAKPKAEAEPPPESGRRRSGRLNKVT